MVATHPALSNALPMDGLITNYAIKKYINQSPDRYESLILEGRAGAGVQGSDATINYILNWNLLGA